MRPEQRREIEEAYRGWAESYDRLMRRTYHRVERAISKVHLLRHLPELPGGLRLGAGSGDAIRAVELIQEGRAGRGVAADLSPDMLRLARKRVAWTEAPIDLLRADVTSLPFPDRSFDVVLCLGGVVSHCPDHHQAVRELCRVVREGGHIALSVDGRAVGFRTAMRARSQRALRSLLATGTARIFHHPTFPFEVHFFTPEGIRI